MKTVIATALSLSLLISGMAIAAPAAGPQQRPEATPSRSQQAAPGRASIATQMAPGKKAALAPAAQHHAAAAPKTTGRAPASSQQHRAHRKGERLQPSHRGVRVSDLRGKGLRSPARGQEWRQLEGKYLLISTATGTILDILTARR